MLDLVPRPQNHLLKIPIPTACLDLSYQSWSWQGYTQAEIQKIHLPQSLDKDAPIYLNYFLNYVIEQESSYLNEGNNKDYQNSLLFFLITL